MDAAGFLDRVPLPLILGGLILTMLATWIVGHELGLRDRARCDEESRSHATGLHGATLGLLALLLGFTFSMAAQRFEANRDAVVREASGIETAYLRADLAPEPQRRALRDLLRRYVDTRVAFYQAKADLRRRASVDAASRRLQGEMWRQAVTLAARAPTCITALLVDSVNQLTDHYEQRVHAVRNHVPPTIMWLLTIMALAATGITGYVAGFGNRRHPTTTSIVLVLIALVIVVIVDLDRPTRGIIQGGQESMLELQKMVRSPGTPPR